MIKPVLVAAALAFFFRAFPQQVPVAAALQLEVHKYKLPYFIQTENKLGSQRMDNTETIFIPDGNIPAVRFKRKEKGLPDLVVYYYFRKDSSIYHILYEWDDANFTDYDKIRIRTQTELNAFVNRYKEIVDRVSGAFGESKVDGSLDDLSRVEKGDFQRKDDWSPNDSTSAEAYITLSSQREVHGMISTTPTYRIRLYVNSIDPGNNSAGPAQPRTCNYRRSQRLSNPTIRWKFL